MIAPELRRLFFAEHWPIRTIAATLGVHHDTVRLAIENERFTRDQVGRAGPGGRSHDPHPPGPAVAR
jgi:hypothetical protein